MVAADQGRGLSDVTIAMFGRAAETPWRRRIAYLWGEFAAVETFALPPLKSYALLELTTRDVVGHTSTDRVWLRPQPPPEWARHNPDRTWTARLHRTVVDAPSLRKLLTTALKGISLKNLVPKDLGKAVGHRLSIGSLDHAPPKLALEWAFHRLTLRITIPDLVARVRISGLIDKDVTARGTIIVDAPVQLRVDGGRATLGFGLATIKLDPFEVSVPGASGAVRSMVQTRAATQLNARLQEVAKALRPAVAASLRRLIAAPVLGGDLKRRVRVERLHIQPEGVAADWSLTPEASSKVPPLAPCPKRPAPPSDERSTPHVVLELPLDAAAEVLGELWLLHDQRGPEKLDLGAASVALSATLPPLFLGCVEPHKRQLWLQVAGLELKGKIGKGLLALPLSAQVGATLALEFRSHQGRAQVRVIPSWLWSSARILSEVVNQQLAPWTRWKDLPDVPIALPASEAVEGLDKGLTLRLRRVTPHGQRLRIEGDLL